MDELLGPLRRAADQVGEPLFLELLRWHRAVIGLLQGLGRGSGGEPGSTTDGRSGRT